MELDLSKIKAAEAAGRFFQYQVDNDNVTKESFYLTFGSVYTLEDFGTIREGLFVAIGTGHKLTGTGYPSSISKFNRFISKNPLKMVGMRLSSTNPTVSQMDTNISVDIYNPFKQGLLNQQAIPLQRYRNEYVYQNNILTLPIVVDWNNQSIIKMEIVQKTLLTITVFFEEVFNRAKLAAMQ